MVKDVSFLKSYLPCTSEISLFSFEHLVISGAPGARPKIYSSVVIWATCLYGEFYDLVPQAHVSPAAGVFSVNYPPGHQCAHRCQFRWASVCLSGSNGL